MKRFKDYLMIIESQQKLLIYNIIKEIENKKIIEKVSELSVDDVVDESEDDIFTLENLSKEFEKIIKEFEKSSDLNKKETYNKISNLIDEMKPLLEEILDDDKTNFILKPIGRGIFFTLYKYNLKNKNYQFNQWDDLKNNRSIKSKIDSYDF